MDAKQIFSAIKSGDTARVQTLVNQVMAVKTSQQIEQLQSATIKGLALGESKDRK